MTFNTHTNRFATLILAFVLGFSPLGCSNLDNSQKGAIIGSGAGAAAGAAIGNMVGDTVAGAMVGALVGGTAGAVIGRQMDEQAESLADDLEGAEIQRVGEGIVVTFDTGILFNFDSADLLPASTENLENLAQSLMKYDNTEVLVVGHTDNVGTDSYNQGLSERRANAASGLLTARGLSPSRITSVGRGESEPIASNDTDSDRRLNRRVEIAIFADEEFQEQAMSGTDG